MPVDPYSPCPGGTGKKIKFCCPDLTGELDKIQRMIESGQRAACLDHIENLSARYPDRACLLSIRATLESHSGSREKAASTLASYMEKYPDNPVALAESAALKASQEGGQAAVATLQKAIEACRDQVPVQVYDAIGIVAQALLAEGRIIAARAHLLMQLAVGHDDQKRTMSLMVGINGSPSVPLLFKEDLPLLPAPDDALWKANFAATTELAMRGAWLAAADRLVELAAKAGDWAPIWRNVATLRSWLGDHDGAVAALRKYAQQPDVPLDDAVEAGALAQLLDPSSLDMIDVVTIGYPTSDFEKLLALVSASPQAVRIPVDLTRLAREDEPPPKGAFWLLDRPVPQSGSGIRREDIPQVVGQIFLFGKQTDRAARMELIAYRTGELAKGKSTAAQLFGEVLQSPAGEEVATSVPAVQHLLSWNWRLPDDTPPADRQRLMVEQRRAVLLDLWPDQPQKQLGGRRPREVAADPAYRNRLLAAILLLELSSEQTAAEFDFNDLRAQLKLPIAGPIGSPQSIREVPLARLARLDPAKLKTEDLVEAYQRADHYRHVKALRKLAEEVVRRDDLPSDFDKAAAYGALAEIETDVAKAVGLLDKARETAESAGHSSGPWDVAELTLRLAQGEVAEADRLLQHIRDEHLREPGVAQALYQILAEAGIIGPDGAPVAGPGGAPATAAVPSPPQAEPGKLWTPGTTAAPAKKSAIWTPD